MSIPVAATSHLIALGFSEIESDAYVFLLRESPATGYRVAQAIGRTAANTYKALETLEERGAVMVEEGDSRLYRAVELPELLKGLEKIFLRHRDGAVRALARLPAMRTDERTYQMRTSDQVIERCFSILGRAQHVVLLDIFPELLALLREPIAECVKRGIRVAILLYEATSMPGATLVENHQASTVRDRWPGQWVNLAADSSEQIHALLTPDGREVVHATWSGSPFLAHLYQSGLLGELLASAIRNEMRRGASRDEVDAIVSEISRFEHADTPAFAGLTSAPLRRARRTE
jgi:HTH-type transcriptional regulator, sugar sensing transcriptional regulator